MALKAKPGEMDRRITLSQRDSGTRTPTGGTTYNYAPITNGTVSAAMKVLNVREKVQAGQQMIDDLRSFVIWFRDDLKDPTVAGTMRIDFEGATYQVVGHSEIGSREQIELTARRLK